MDVFSPSRLELRGLPGLAPQTDGSIDFERSAEEERAVCELFQTFKDCDVHPDFAEPLKRAGNAFALCRYAIQLGFSLPEIETEDEHRAKAQEVSSILSRALAALYKAMMIYPSVWIGS